MVLVNLSTVPRVVNQYQKNTFNKLISTCIKNSNSLLSIKQKNNSTSSDFGPSTLLISYVMYTLMK